ncbi:MAG: tyrosine-type recombinase/integrase [Sulfitobacter sp.]
MPTYHTHFQPFLAQCREQKGLSENTLLGYHQDINAFLQFCVLHPSATHGSVEHVLSYLRLLRDKKRYKPATVRRRMVTLRKFLSWVAIEENEPLAIEGLDLDLRIPKRLPRPIDRETLRIVFKNAKPLSPNINLPDQNKNAGFSGQQITGLATRVLVATGLRIGELTNLRVCDVSGASSRIRVIGKGDRERTVYVTNEKLLDDLNAYVSWRQKSCAAKDCLFLNNRGQRLTEATFRKRLRAFSGRLDLPEHLTPHRFRHSAATLLIEEGVDIRIVQRLLGHASIATTELYTQVSDMSLVAAIQRADTLGKVDSK